MPSLEGRMPLLDVGSALCLPAQPIAQGEDQVLAKRLVAPSVRFERPVHQADRLGGVLPLQTEHAQHIECIGIVRRVGKHAPIQLLSAFAVSGPLRRKRPVL